MAILGSLCHYLPLRFHQSLWCLCQKMTLKDGNHRSSVTSLGQIFDAIVSGRSRWFLDVQGRTLDALDAEIPRAAFSLNDMSTFTVLDEHLMQNTNPNNEGVAFYINLIELVHTREQSLRGQPMGDPSALTQRQYSSKRETMTEIASYWRLAS
jgi:uncharacterized membrane protein YccC